MKFAVTNMGGLNQKELVKEYPKLLDFGYECDETVTPLRGYVTFDQLDNLVEFSRSTGVICISVEPSITKFYGGYPLLTLIDD